MYRTKKRLWTAGLYFAQPCVKNVKRSYVATAQATARPVNSQLFKGKGMNGEHLEYSTIATFGPRCWTICVSICHLPSN